MRTSLLQRTSPLLLEDQKIETHDLLLSPRIVKFRDFAYKYSKDEVQCLRVLLIDDCGSDRILLHSTLEEFGHKVIELDSGVACLNVITKALTAAAYGGDGCAFHVTLVNDTATDMHGPDIVKRLREVEYEGVVIALTGTENKEMANQFREYGADAVLRKPCTIFDFYRCIQGEVALSQFAGIYFEIS